VLRGAEDFGDVLAWVTNRFETASLAFTHIPLRHSPPDKVPIGQVQHIGSNRLVMQRNCRYEVKVVLYSIQFFLRRRSGPTWAIELSSLLAALAFTPRHHALQAIS